jgi:putative FmdB family regulatory protein
MPIYEYQCRHCRNRFEYLLLASSPAPECPDCRSQDLEQLISLSSVSSEGTRQANLGAAHQKACAVRKEKQHAEHKRLHDHFD